MVQNNTSYQRKRKKKKKSSPPWLIIAIFAVVPILGITAMVLSGNDESATLKEGVEESDGTSSEGDVQPVKISGEALAPFLPGVNDPAIGLTVPSIDGYSFDGSPISLLDLDSGKPTVIVVAAHWCPHCNTEIPRLVNMNEKGTLPEDVNFIMVSTSPKPASPNFPPSQWVDDKGWPFPVLADSKNDDVLNALGATGFPFMIVVDENGIVLDRKSGAASETEIILFIESALGR